MDIDPFKSFLGFLKLAPRYLVALVTAGAFLLFGSENFLKKLGVFDFTQHYREWIGITFLLSSALCGVFISTKTFTNVKKWIRRSKRDRRLLQKLHCLTEGEKQILILCMANQLNSSNAFIHNGIVRGLVSAGIITYCFGPTEYYYTVNETAGNHLNNHPELLVGSTKSPQD